MRNLTHIIIRYNLLLRDLLSKTPEDHPDHENLQKALRMIEEVAATINEHVRQEEKVYYFSFSLFPLSFILEIYFLSEKARSLHAISKSISGLPDLVVPHRRLLREGELVSVDKQGKKVQFIFFLSLRRESETSIQYSTTF